MAFQEPEALVPYYLNQDKESAYLEITQLYSSGAIPSDKKRALTRDDFMTWADALRRIGEYNQAVGKYGEMAKSAGPICSDNDEIGYTYLSKYIAERRPQDLDAAWNSYQQAINCDPRDTRAYSDSGSILIRKWMAGNKHDDRLAKAALQQLQRALDIDQQWLPAIVNVGYLQYQSGQHEQAIRYFEDNSHRFPNDASLFLNFGYLLYQEYLGGKSDLLDDAIDKTEKAWDLDRKSYAAANNLGFFYLEAG
jgi:tetratricopeptide (TPR) repeat protein